MAGRGEIVLYIVVNRGVHDVLGAHAARVAHREWHILYRPRDRSPQIDEREASTPQLEPVGGG